MSKKECRFKGVCDASDETCFNTTLCGIKDTFMHKNVKFIKSSKAKFTKCK